MEFDNTETIKARVEITLRRFNPAGTDRRPRNRGRNTDRGATGRERIRTTARHRPAARNKVLAKTATRFLAPLAGRRAAAGARGEETGAIDDNGANRPSRGPAARDDLGGSIDEITSDLSAKTADEHAAKNAAPNRPWRSATVPRTKAKAATTNSPNALAIKSARRTCRCSRRACQQHPIQLS